VCQPVPNNDLYGNGTLLLLGLIAATVLVGRAISAWWRRTRSEAAPAA